MNEIVSSLSKKKNSRSSFWVQLWVRKASFPLTYIFINTGWSANQVSILSWIIIFISAICLSINNSLWILVGVILTNLWLILDCVDGNIARVKREKSFMGDFFDAIAGYGPFSVSTLGLGIAAFHTTHIFPENIKYWLIALGGLAGICNLYMRLIHQKYLNCFFVAKKILNELDDISLKDSEDKNSFAYIREKIDKNLGVSGLFMPWLFVAYFTNTFDIMLMFYSLYYIVSFIIISYIYSLCAEKFDKHTKYPN